MIQEARYCDVQNLTGYERTMCGLRVLTMRKWPRGLRKIDVDVWIKDAGPSLELLADWRAGQIDWQAFLERYQSEQMARETCEIVEYRDGERVCVRTVAQSPVDYLERLSERQQVTVLCWEKEQCHRFALVELVKGLCGIRSCCSILIENHPDFLAYSLYIFKHADRDYISSLLAYEWKHRNSCCGVAMAIRIRDIWLKLSELAREGGFESMSLKLFEHYERMCHLVMAYQMS
jgi:uncharacterized protein YeaO (DUF488 family)